MGTTEKLEWVEPEEGFALWVDNFAIPKGFNSKYAAHLFMDYCLRPEVQAKLSNWIWYLPVMIEKATAAGLDAYVLTTMPAQADVDARASSSTTSASSAAPTPRPGPRSRAPDPLTPHFRRADAGDETTRGPPMAAPFVCSGPGPAPVTVVAPAPSARRDSLAGRSAPRTHQAGHFQGTGTPSSCATCFQLGSDRPRAAPASPR